MTTQQPDNERRLSAYLDGDLDPIERADLERAIESDESLRHDFEDLRMTVAALRTLPHEAPPRSFRLSDDMLGRAAAPNIVSLPERRARRRPITFWLRAAASLAAAIAVALVSVDTLANIGSAPTATEHLASKPAPASAPAAAPVPSVASGFRGPASATPPVQPRSAPGATQEPSPSDSAASGTAEPPPQPAPAAPLSNTDGGDRPQASTTADAGETDRAPAAAPTPGETGAVPAVAPRGGATGAAPPPVFSSPISPLRVAASAILIAAGVLAGLSLFLGRRS